MTYQQGRYTNMGIGLESVRDTPQTANLVWVPTTDRTRTRTPNWLTRDEARNSRDMKSGLDVAQRPTEISFSGYVYDGVFPTLLLLGLGKKTKNDDTPVAGVTQHIFGREESNYETIPTATLYWEDKDIVEQYAGAVLNTLSIESAFDGHATYTATFITRTPEIVTTQSPTYVDNLLFVGRSLEYQVGATIGSLGSVLPIQSFNLEINNNVSGVGTDTEGNPEAIVSGDHDVTLTTERTWSGVAQDSLFKAEDDIAMRFVWKSQQFITGTTPYRLQIDIEQAKIEANEPTAGNADIMNQSATITPYRDLGRVGNVVDFTIETAFDFA